MIDSICLIYGTIGVERLNGYTKREFTFGMVFSGHRQMASE